MKYFLSFYIGLTGLVCQSFAQTTVVRGKVTDLNTGEPLPFVNIYFSNTTTGTTTDFDGNYTIRTNYPSDTLVASYIGYIPKSRKIRKGQEQSLNFQLEPDEKQLEEVVVMSGENPAHRIIKGAIENRRLNDKNSLPAFEFESYTKIEIDVDNITEKFKKRKVIREIIGVADSIRELRGDDGKPVFPIFISESMSDYYQRANPKMKKEIIRKTKVTGVGFEERSAVQQLIGSTFQEYNFYDAHVSLFYKNFTTPLADSWNFYYDFLLQDSLYIDNDFCYKIDVRPKRKEDLVFTGTMWITANEFAIKQVDFMVGKEANLNFIEKIKIQQTLARTGATQWLPEKTRILVDIGELSEKWAGLLAKFYTSNRNFVIDRPKDVRFFNTALEIEEEAKLTDNEFWDENRHDPLTQEDLVVYKMLDTIQDLPTVRTYVEVINIIYDGYKRVGKVDFGNYLWLYTFNNVEGHRFRAGMRTNSSFSRKWSFGGYLAYGTLDQNYKYGAYTRFVLDRKRWTETGVSFTYDIDQVGLIAEDLTSSPLFLAFTRFGTLNRPFYNTIIDYHFSREVYKGLSNTVKLRKRYFDPLYDFSYRKEPLNPMSELRSSFNSTEVILEARYARDEVFIQNDHNQRESVQLGKWPAFTFRYTAGLMGLLDGDFNYHKFQFGVAQEINTGILGNAYYELKAGLVQGNLPYPLLQVHLGNNSPFYNSLSYNLMNLFEFVSDQYVSFRYVQHFEGLLLNHIYLVKKLKWRFVATTNILYGNTSEQNRALSITRDGEGNILPNFYTLEKEPYIEVGYGIENVFRVLRFEAIHRLTYRDNPGATNFMIKVAFQFAL